MQINSIRFKLPAMIAIAFIVAAICVITMADYELTRIVDRSQIQIYSEKLNIILGMIGRKYQRLQKTMMVEAYDEAFRLSVASALEKDYYAAAADERTDSKHPQVYPFIIDDKGLVVLYPGLQYGDKSLQEAPFAKRIVASKNGHITYSYRGEERDCIFKYFKGWRWIVCYSIPLDIKHADSSRFIKNLMLIMALITVSAVVLLTTIITRYIQPIIMLSKIATEMVEGNLTQNINVTGRDEIGILARHFAEMRDAIRDKIVHLNEEVLVRKKAELKIRQLHREHSQQLEMQVEQRTIELTKSNEQLKKEIADRGRAEQALKKSEENYRSIFHAANDAISVHEMNTGRILDVNDRMLEMYAFERKKDVVGSSFRRLSSGKTPYTEKEAGEWAAKAIDGVPQVFEWHARDSNGRLFWTEVSLKRVVIGGEDRILAIVRDIDERKAAERELRESEERYRSFFTTRIAAMSIFDVETREFVDVNQAFLDLYGYTEDEALQLTIEAVNAEPEAMEAVIQQSATIGDIYIPEMRHRKKDGTEFFTELSGVPFAWKGRKLMYLMTRDITERKIANEKLRESERRLGEAHRIASLGNWDWDINSGELVWSDEMFRIYGIAPGGFEGTVEAFLRLVHPRDRAQVVESIHEALYGAQTYGIDHRIVLRDGTVRMVHEEGQVYFDEAGIPVRMIGTIQDITQRKQVEEELKRARDAADEANRAKNEFLANMSHEIRTPMNAIVGLADLALRTDVPPKLRDYLDKIRFSSQSLVRIVDDILDFSKIEAEKLDLEMANFDLRNVITNVSDLVSGPAAKKGIEFLVSIGSDVPCALVGDPVRLGQVLTNLTINAVKFTSRGEVLVKVQLLERASSHVKLGFSVRDTGIGIAAEHLTKLFEPFTQADGTTTRQYGGSGLGLAICRRLVEIMGGEIRVESEEGKGSLFSFQVDFECQSRDAEARLISPGDMHGMNVLVVDDNLMSREILVEMLQSFGFEATSVESGVKAVEELVRAAKDEPFELVLMDWRMPGMNGIETARRIDRDPRLSDRIPKIIMVTAYAHQDLRQEAKEAGLEGFLVKPIQPSLLFDTIMGVFGRELLQVVPQPPGRAPVAGESENLKGARILIVEDNEINQQVAQEILQSAGARVWIASNGKESIEAVNRHEFDAVLMDVQMPEMDGYEATRMIRGNDRFKDLPIIAMTAHAMKGDREKSLEAGMNDHVSKPIDAGVLLEVLGAWLDYSDKELPTDESSPEDSTLEKDSELPDSLPGIDIGSALDRLQGNTTLLRKLLHDFAKNHGDSGKQLRQAIDSRDYTTARNVAHSLKGSAGALSMSALHNAASDLEQAAVRGHHEQCERSLAAFQQALAQVCKGIAHWVEITEHKRPEGPAFRERSDAVDLE